MHHATKREILIVILFFIILIAFSWLALGLSTEGPLNTQLTSFDTAIQQKMDVDFSPVLAQGMLFVTYLANPEVIVAMYVILLLLFFVIHRKVLASFFLTGLLIGEALSIAFKNTFERVRPDVGLYAVSHSGFSFPSGHALIATIFYGFAAFCLVHLFKKTWQKMVTTIIAFLLIFFIGFSRIFFGVHWATDVIGGWLLGLAVLILLIELFTLLHQRITWGKLKMPHGIVLGATILLLAQLSFYIIYFYVTHELIIRSTI